MSAAPADKPIYEKPLLCLDFDGTLTTFESGWQGAQTTADPPTPGSMDFLREALKHFTVAIHSARSLYAEGRRCMWSWLVAHYGAHHGITFEEAAKELKPVQFPVSKPHAHVSIDDRAVTFKGKWPEVEDIKNFKPWNRG